VADRTKISSLEAMAAGRLDALEQQALRRRLAATARSDDGVAARDGRVLTSFCCNDYLGLSQHPAVKQAAHQAIDAFGAGAGASRLVTGNHPLYEDLERRLAALKETEAALVFGSGYLANLAIPPALAGTGDLIVADELVHASMHAGIRASRAEVRFFPHNDADACGRVLADERASFRHCLIMTEGVFSMDGDCAPLAALSEIADARDAWLMTDDAHGLGVLGEGRGSAAAAGVSDRVPLQMGTLSKAVGSYGGYLCASRAVIDLMINRARSLIYATGLPPAAVAASSAALDLVANDRRLVAAPMEKASRFCAALGLPEPESPIVPLIVGAAERALDASAALAEQGFLVTAIRPPTVPDGTARLRFTFQATHKDEDVDRLAAAVRETGLAG
jgi:8-amino-7-oxononanoate synthase